MKVKIGSYPDYDEIEVDEKHEFMEFSELPGRPKLTFNPEGSITIRLDGGAVGVMIIKPEASNSCTIGARK